MTKEPIPYWHKVAADIQLGLLDIVETLSEEATVICGGIYMKKKDWTREKIAVRRAQLQEILDTPHLPCVFRDRVAVAPAGENT